MRAGSVRSAGHAAWLRHGARPQPGSMLACTAILVWGLRWPCMSGASLQRKACGGRGSGQGPLPLGAALPAEPRRAGIVGHGVRAHARRARDLWCGQGQQPCKNHKCLLSKSGRLPACVQAPGGPVCFGCGAPCNAPLESNGNACRQLRTMSCSTSSDVARRMRGSHAAVRMAHALRMLLGPDSTACNNLWSESALAITRTSQRERTGHPDSVAPRRPARSARPADGAAVGGRQLRRLRRRRLARVPGDRRLRAAAHVLRCAAAHSAAAPRLQPAAATHCLTACGHLCRHDPAASRARAVPPHSGAGPLPGDREYLFCQRCCSQLRARALPPRSGGGQLPRDRLRAHRLPGLRRR